MVAGRAWILLLCGLAALGAQSELPRDLTLLAQIKARMARNLARAPNYTCLETIERSQRSHPSQHPRLVDRLRVEVALVGGRELFSWPGAEEFQEGSLYDLVGGGTAATGDFAIYSRALFTTKAPTFEFKGEESRRSRPTHRYGYRVSRLVSGYKITIGDQSAIAGYHGDFWADRETFDVIRLEVHADDVAGELGIDDAFTEIEYGNARIGDSEFLLPQNVLFTLKLNSGEERHNHTVFTDCRQYVGRSEITFGDNPEPSRSPATTEIGETKLPAGIVVDAHLTTMVDSEKSAVGDPITATVVSDVKQDGVKIVPKGATLTGRIRRLERRMGRAEFYLVSLEFSRLEFGNRRAKFFGQLVTVGPIFGVRPRQSAVVPLEKPDGTGLLLVETSRLRLSPGFRMEWRTATPREPPARPRSTAR